MFGIRTFVIATIAMVGGTAAAQFDGPAPLAWRWQQSSPVSPSGSPLVDGNNIYFNLGNRIYAIDRETGNTKWKYPNGAPLTGTVKRSPILVNGVLCSYTDQREVYGINPQTGELKWVYQAPFQISGQMVAAGNTVAFPMDGGNISGVDTATGNTVYPDGPYRILDGMRGPIYSDGRDVISFFDNRNYLQAFSLSTRKPAWKQNFGSTPPDGTMTSSEGYLYTYTGAFVACLSAFSGSVKWQAPAPERMMFSPEVGGGMVLAVGQSGKCYIYDMNGQLLNARKPIELGSQPAVKPTCVGKKFIVATANGALHLINPTTGTIDWQYYIRPMNDAARNASSSSGNQGASSGPGFGQQGNRGGSNGNSSDPIVTVDVAAAVSIAGRTLLVPAVDASMLAFDLDSGVDLTGPDVKQVWPAAGELLSGKNGQEFIFKVEDEASGVNVSTLKMDIDGVPYNYDFGRDGYLICQISTSKKNNMLSNGRHTVHIIATDWMGNVTNYSSTLRIDNSLDPLKRGGDTNRPNGGGPGGTGPGFGGGTGVGGG